VQDLSAKNEVHCQKTDKLTKKEIRQLRSSIISERSKSLRPLEIKINALEKAIDANETYLGQLHDKMQSATEKNDGPLITDLSQKIHQCQIDIERDFELFESISEAVETKRASFDLKLLELDEIEC
jgi:ATP-binding cassette subfamily F protein 3